VGTVLIVQAGGGGEGGGGSCSCGKTTRKLIDAQKGYRNRGEEPTYRVDKELGGGARNALLTQVRERQLNEKNSGPKKDEKERLLKCPTKYHCRNRRLFERRLLNVQRQRL